MAKIDRARRAEIGREKRERTRTLIVDAGTMLMAERPREAIRVDAVVEAAGVAKGTFYYHFQSIDELAAAVGARLSKSFDKLLTPVRVEIGGPVERLSFGFTQFLEKAISDADWARLVVQTSQSAPEFNLSVRASLKADLAEAILHGRVSVRDVEMGADIVLGIWLQVTRGILERGARTELTRQAVEAALRSIGATGR
ncbi:TetR family transcriptional regulator [Mesorhizobium sp. L-8-3]|nr:TetR family transcriptional regulator [Mesorhizobium sp. L-8-3]